MASPFPGMDPYLEGELWPGFHDLLATQICAQLTPRISPKYVARLAQRYVLLQPGSGEVYNTGRAMRMAANDKTTPIQPVDPEAANSPEVSPPSMELPSPLPEEIPLLSVEIRAAEERRLITVIELLSPVNKHSDGVLAYRRRRTTLIRTSVHLLEIDLLRHGERIELIGAPPSAPYYIYLSRVQRRPYTQIWAVGLRQPLPVVPVPLLPPDPDAPLDLQAAVRSCFERENYDHLLDYSTRLDYLSEEDAAWVESIVR